MRWARLSVAALLVAARAAACPELAVEAAAANPYGELQLGATNVNAALGSGRLTATVSRCGEVTGFKWPGPSYYDQLAYLTANAPDARRRPHFGALDDMGAFAGVAVRTRRGRSFTWLRDDEWSHVQRYSADTSDVLVTETRNAALRLRVTAWTFVLPERDVLVSHYVVTRERGSPVRDARLVFYTNFSPTLSRLQFIPLADTALDFANDYAVVYDRKTRALLHFLPASANGVPHDFSRLNPLLRSPPRGRALARAVQELVGGLTEAGVYLAIGAAGGDDGYQCGFDDAPLCAHQSAFIDQLLASSGQDPTTAAAARAVLSCTTREPAGPLDACRTANRWTYRAENAFTDARDGRLARSPIAACQANAALARRLRFRRGMATATFYVAAAGTRDAAYDLLRQARAGRPEAQRAATEAWWADYLAPAHLPDTGDAAVLTFARRALVVMRTATDAASGAIVASVAPQEPYGFDWPRDGAFINYALDLAGYHDVVSRHNRFYARVQRREFGPWSIVYSFVCPADPAARAYPDCVPPGTFENNYYADPDVVLAGTPFSFEIDEAGLGVWTLWEHARWLTDPAARAAYLADVCPAIERGAVNLAACRDPATRLQCAANEDDSMALTQGLQGAETVLLALRSAVAAAGDCRFDAGLAAGWQSRAAELEQAIVDHFRVAGPPEHFEGGRPGWLLWPVGFPDAADPRALGHAQYLKASFIDPLLARTAPGGAYNSEALLARAQLFRARGDAAGVADAQETVRAFVRMLPTPDTHHLGEFYARVDADLDGDGVAPDYVSENDVPHVWEHAYLYAAAMVAFGSR
jgi:hypothetical protein